MNRLLSGQTHPYGLYTPGYYPVRLELNPLLQPGIYQLRVKMIDGVTETRRMQRKGNRRFTTPSGIHDICLLQMHNKRTSAMRSNFWVTTQQHIKHKTVSKLHCGGRQKEYQLPIISALFIYMILSKTKLSSRMTQYHGIGPIPQHGGTKMR